MMLWYDPYKVTPSELIKAFQKALMEAKDAKVEEDAVARWQYSSYLANAMAARMRGFVPNIRPNDEVKRNGENACATMVFDGKETAVVARVWFDNEGVLSLGFANLPFDMTVEAKQFLPVTRVFDPK